jgi:hypothetical protein
MERMELPLTYNVPQKTTIYIDHVINHMVACGWILLKML